MGPVTLPTRGYVYLDTQAIIYSVESHPSYYRALRPLWASVQARELVVVTSELTILEALVGPMRSHDAALEGQYERFFDLPGLDLVPMARPYLRQAARLRADNPFLRTPDAIHAASALLSACATFITNDRAFGRLTGFTVIQLDDLAGG